jgi:SNF-related kinase/serine kinase
MLTKSPPFRGAHMKDPYFRRLSAADKKAFWKIFAQLDLSESAKDLFERMVERVPSARMSINDVKAHPWVQGETLEEGELAEKLQEKYI